MIRLFALLFLFPCILFAQDEVDVQFGLTFRGVPVQKGVWYTTQSKDSVQFETLKFFVSQTPENKKDLLVRNVKLIDWSVPESQHMMMVLNDKKELEFTFGLDSIFHVSDIMDGDLDPSLGMYWAWQSGYVQLKVEGVSPNSKTRNNKFQFHIGGYLHPYSVSRLYNFGSVSSEKILIELDLWTLFGTLQLNEKSEIMIPGKEAIHFLKEKEHIFEVRKNP